MPSDQSTDAEAARIASFAPFWGPQPGSNRWHDLEYETPDGAVIAPGEAVRRAVDAGLLLAERHEAPGLVLADPEGGDLEMRWRYHPVDAGNE